MEHPSHWLVKSEPSAYSWQQFLKDKRTMWEGVRNYQARNNLRRMNKGDLVLFYHSVTSKEVVGIAEVIRPHYPDPTAKDGKDWVVVDLKPVKELPRPVHLKQIKADARLENLALVKQARLSVLPLRPEEFDAIVEMGNPEQQSL